MNTQYLITICHTESGFHWVHKEFWVKEDEINSTITYWQETHPQSHIDSIEVVKM